MLVLQSIVNVILEALILLIQSPKRVKRILMPIAILITKGEYRGVYSLGITHLSKRQIN